MDFAYIDLKRREKGLSVSKLCNLADINRSTYYKIRTSEDIKLSTLRKLFDVLDLNMAEQRRIVG